MKPGAETRLFSKFVVVGALGFATDAGLLMIGSRLGFSTGFSRAISLGAALHLTFLLNGAFVFGAFGQGLLARQWGGYMLANGFGALCNYAVFVGMTSAHLPVVSAAPAAFVAAAVVGLAVNFTGTRLVAFRR